MSATLLLRGGLKPRNVRRGQFGFSTIEAMVAVAILGIALIPLYGFQNTIVRGSAKVESTLDAQVIDRLAKTYIKGLMPAQLNVANGRLGDLSLSWEVREIQPERSVLGTNGLDGRFRVRFVRVIYRVDDADGRTLTTGAMDRLTWVETRSFMAALEP